MPIHYTPEFKQQIRRLGRRYRSIRQDLQGLIEQLQAGEVPGDQISGVGFTVYKARIKNRDARKGKSGGYRVIYYVKTHADIILLSIYSKSDQADITADTVRRILNAYQGQ